MPNYCTSDIFSLSILTSYHNWQANQPKQVESSHDLLKSSDNLAWRTFTSVDCGIKGKPYDMVKSMYTNSKFAVKLVTNRFPLSESWSETGLWFESHTIQYTHQWTNEGSGTVCSTWSCSIRHWSQMSPVCRWSGAAVAHNRRFTATSRLPAHPLTVNTKKSK